jgi:(p)ppGpp synthase/HD superfamily hydrolase
MNAMSEYLDKAIEIAVQAHTGQIDKAGAPYILHPLRVMMAQTTDLARAAAVLHDVVEDTPISLATLRARDIPDEVVKAVELLTRPEGEHDYDDYLERISQNEIAKAVKLADLKDNMDLSRIRTVTDKDMARIKKYAAAYQYLQPSRPFICS